MINTTSFASHFSLSNTETAVDFYSFFLIFNNNATDGNGIFINTNTKIKSMNKYILWVQCIQLFPLYKRRNILTNEFLAIWIKKEEELFIEIFLSIFRYSSNGMNENNQTILFNESPSLFHVILLAITMFSLSLMTIFGNTVVIYALRTNRHLRTVSFRPT